MLKQAGITSTLRQNFREQEYTPGLEIIKGFIETLCIRVGT